MKRNKINLPPFKVEKVVGALSEVVDWGLLQHGVPKTWEKTMGEGVNVYILDTAGESVHPDLVANIKGGRNFSQSKSGEDVAGHGCVSADTLIHTTEGGIETIQELYDRIDEEEIYSSEYKGYVKDISKLNIKTFSFNPITRKTETDKIKLLHKTKIKENVINVELAGNIKLELTPWHKIYTIKALTHKRLDINKKEASKLEEGEMIVVPRGKFEGLSDEYVSIKGSEYRKCLFCGRKQYFHTKERKNKWQCRECAKGKFELKADKYIIDEDWGYLLGLILTDGHVYKTKGQYRIDISSSNIAFLREVQKILIKKNIDNSVIDKTRNCYRLRFDNKSIHLMIQNAGIKKGAKSITQDMPKSISKSKGSVIHAFIAGVLDGDRCISGRSEKHRITTASKSFAKQMCALLHSIGIIASYRKYKQYNSALIKRTDSSAEVFNVEFSAMREEISNRLLIDYKKKRAKNSLREQNVFGKKIKKISKNKVNEYYYDFTVEKNHTYLANGCFVSNTHCAGTVAAEKNGTGVVGVAPKANLFLIKVLDDSGSGSIRAIAEGLEYCLRELHGEYPPHIVSMSLGSDSRLGRRCEKAINELYEKNVCIVCAAGNSGTEGVNYPAKYSPKVIAVGAYDKNGRLANFSTTGDEVDFAAPGVDIYSTWPKSGYAKLSGTSMATPFVAGIVALLISKHLKQEAETGKNDCKTVDQIREHLVKHCIDKGTVGRDKKWGYGVINIGELLEN